MDAIMQYVQWGGIVSIVFVGLCLVFSAILQSRPRRIRLVVFLLAATVEVLAGVALIWLTSVVLTPAWMIGMAVAGLIGGWFAGTMTKVGFKDGVRAAKLSPIAPWITAIVYTAALAALFFGSVSVFAAACQAVVFAAAFTAGSAVSSAFKIVRAKPNAAPRGSESELAVAEEVA